MYLHSEFDGPSHDQSWRDTFYDMAIDLDNLFELFDDPDTEEE